MTRKNFFIAYKNPIGILLAFLLIGGVFVYGKLKTSLFPEITFPKIKVIADAGLQPVQKMMVTVTKPLEAAIKQVPDLQNIRSVTSRGSCEISAYMDWNTDIDLAKQRIESKISQVSGQLPPDVQITVEKMNPSILPVIGFSLETTSKRSAIDMKQIALYTVKPFLSQVSGVSEVRIIGGKQKEYWLTLDLQRMSVLGITPEYLAATMAQTNFIKSNGYLSDFHLLYLTVSDASYHSAEELKNLVVSNRGKRIVRVRDIAEVSIREAVEYTRINANGKEGILVAIIKQPNENLIELNDRMEAQVNALKKILPKDISLRPYYVQADFVKDSIKSVLDSLLIGLALAIGIAILFLHSWRASLTILFTIPITVGLSLIVMYAVGYTLNIMTLGALAAAIGLVIDDAIVVVEQIQRTHEENPAEKSGERVGKAIKYLLPAMIGSSLSTIVIFLPFELMSGVAGSYFKVLTNMMIITLTCSFLVSWLGLPVIYLWLSAEKRNALKSATARPVKRKSQRWVYFFIRRPYISILFMAGLAWSIYFILPRLETGFLPEMDEGSIVLDYNSPPGTTLQETDRILRQVEKLIVATPEVSSYSRRTGTEMGFFITEPNRGDYLIQLKKSRTRSTEEVIEDIRKKIESTQPALRIDFGQVIGDMLGDLMTSVQPIAIKIFGNDPVLLDSLATRVAGICREVEGTADVFNGIVIAGPSVAIEPDNNLLSQFGISPASLQFQLQTSLQGIPVGSILEREQMSQVRMVYPRSQELAVMDIQNLQLFLPDARLMPISSLAALKIHGGEAEVKRENLQSLGEVTARLEGRDLGTVIRDIRTRIDAQLSLPQGYHLEYGGDYREQQRSFQELLTILVTASLLVFGTILFLFKDFALSFLVILLGVLGISGSYLALGLTHTPLNVGSYTGLIMIVGIIGENAIFTILQFRDFLGQSTVEEAIVFAISTRLRPKLMTASGAIIALLPLALGIGSGAQLHRPLAIAVIGGFLIALPLLLVVLPSLLRLIYRRQGGSLPPD